MLADSAVYWSASPSDYALGKLIRAVLYVVWMNDGAPYGIPVAHTDIPEYLHKTKEKGDFFDKYIYISYRGGTPVIRNKQYQQEALQLM